MESFQLNTDKISKSKNAQLTLVKRAIQDKLFSYIQTQAYKKINFHVIEVCETMSVELFQFKGAYYSTNGPITEVGELLAIKKNNLKVEKISKHLKYKMEEYVADRAIQYAELEQKKWQIGSLVAAIQCPSDALYLIPEDCRKLCGIEVISYEVSPSNKAIAFKESEPPIYQTLIEAKFLEMVT